MINCKPTTNYNELFDHPDALDRARRAIRQRHDELQFSTLSKGEQEVLKLLGLDPDSRYNECRTIERR